MLKSMGANIWRFNKRKYLPLPIIIVIGNRSETGMREAGNSYLKSKAKAGGVGRLERLLNHAPWFYMEVTVFSWYYCAGGLIARFFSV